MAERLKAPVLKIGRVQKALVGSNPTPSAFHYGLGLRKAELESFGGYSLLYACPRAEGGEIRVPAKASASSVSPYGSIKMN